MEQLFLHILNRSIAASIAAAAVLLVRLLFLRRLPRKYAYALWGVVLFRLCFLGTGLDSVLSLIPSNPTPIPLNLSTALQVPAPSGLATVNSFVAAVVDSNQSAQYASVNPSQVYLCIAAWVWLIGICVLMGIAVAAYIRLRLTLRTATLIEGKVYESDQITTPFVAGFLRPRIYLPVGLPRNSLTYVLAHEETHIHRRDYLVKPLAYCVTILHWFNPLIWVCYAVACRDIEVSCDERVMRTLEGDHRSRYAASLLALAERRFGLLTPLAFGESDVGPRIQNILRWSRPQTWMTVCGAAVLLVMIPLCACRQSPSDGDLGIIGGADGPTAIISSSGLSVEAAAAMVAASEEDIAVSVLHRPAAIWKDQSLGADPPMIDWTDGDTVIFHGYFGLFVVDLNRGETLASLDLRSIGCDATQGDRTCEVRVSEDHEAIYLHAMDQPYRFRYEWKTDTLLLEAKDTPARYEANPYAGEAVQVSPEYQTPMYRFREDQFAYLGYHSWTLGDLFYQELGSDVELAVFTQDSFGEIQAVPTAVITTASGVSVPNVGYYHVLDGKEYTADLADGFAALLTQPAAEVKTAEQTVIALSDAPSPVRKWSVKQCFMGGADAPDRSLLTSGTGVDGVADECDADGSSRFEQETNWQADPVEPVDDTSAEFAVQNNLRMLLSSRLYMEGCVYGYQVSATFEDGNQAIYWFVVRSPQMKEAS